MFTPALVMEHPGEICLVQEMTCEICGVKGHCVLKKLIFVMSSRGDNDVKYFFYKNKTILQPII